MWPSNNVRTQAGDWGGALIVAIVQILGLFIPMVPSIYFPAPVYILLSLMLGLIVFPLVLPVFYLLTSIYGFRRPTIGRTLLIVVGGLSVLNAVWILSCWEYGEKYQGLHHTQIVAIENAIGFSALIGITLYGYWNKSIGMLRVSNFVLFFLLAWCAFPYFGELP